MKISLELNSKFDSKNKWHNNSNINIMFTHRDNSYDT